MKKLSILFMAVMVAVLAGCAGDTTPNEGDLSIVQDVQLDATSAGVTIVLTWSEVSDDIDGYKVYFRADATGSYAEVGESTTTTYTHTADNAGDYVVMAYEGDNSSSANSNAVSTMPNIISTSYTIYDRWSASDRHSAFIFGSTAGQTGLASDTDFYKDMYAWDEDKGDGNVYLYSGTFGYYGSGAGYAGNQSYFQTPESGAWGNCDPNGTWIGTSYQLYASDSVVFVELPYSQGPSSYAKMYNISVTQDPDTPRGTIVSFSYEYQPNTLGLTVFTSAN